LGRRWAGPEGWGWRARHINSRWFDRSTVSGLQINNS
jgi:hypothetical protein